MPGRDLKAMSKMSHPEETTTPKEHAPSPPLAAEAPPQPAASGSAFGVSSVLRRWRRDDLVFRASFALRAWALVFSLLSFVIMVSNKHGGWKDFDNYEEFRYLLAIAILSTVYTGVQAGLHLYHLSTGRRLFTIQNRTFALVDFSCDQVVAYLLISAASTAVPMTNRMRDNVDNLFTDSLAASISMAFFAFFALAFSALISGYKLSTESYV